MFVNLVDIKNCVFQLAIEQSLRKMNLKILSLLAILQFSVINGQENPVGLKDIMMGVLEEKLIQLQIKQGETIQENVELRVW